MTSAMTRRSRWASYSHSLIHGLSNSSNSDDIECLQAQVPNAGLLKGNFSYRCVAADKTSSYTACCTVPLQ